MLSLRHYLTRNSGSIHFVELRWGFFSHVFLISAFVMCSGFFVAVTTKERKQKKNLKVRPNKKPPFWGVRIYSFVCYIMIIN